jgi:hypothetical protein
VTVPQDPANTFAFDMEKIVKQSLTKKSRMDLGRAMIGMCSLSGWQATTLNPDMHDADKLTITTTQFGKIVAEDDADELYAELVRLSAVTMGWAQGIERRASRDRKRAERATRKARKARKKKLKKERAEKKADVKRQDREKVDAHD